MCAPVASLRVRLRGERVPDLLLELQDDERSQSFISHVRRAKQQGENHHHTPSPLCLCMSLYVPLSLCYILTFSLSLPLSLSLHLFLFHCLLVPPVHPLSFVSLYESVCPSLFRLITFSLFFPLSLSLFLFLCLCRYLYLCFLVPGSFIMYCHPSLFINPESRSVPADFLCPLKEFVHTSSLEVREGMYLTAEFSAERSLF